MKKLLLFGLVFVLLSSFVSAEFGYIYRDDFSSSTGNWTLEDDGDTTISITGGVLLMDYGGGGSADTNYAIYSGVNSSNMEAVTEITFEIERDDVSVSEYHEMRLYDTSDSDIAILIRWDGGDVKSYDGTTLETIGTITDNTKSNFTIKNIDWSSQTFDIYQDDVSIASGFGFREDTSTASRLHFQIRPDFNAHEIEIDNFALLGEVETPPPPNSQIFARDYYTGVNLTHFNATINGSEYTTTNGTIYFDYNVVVNITIKATNYYEQTFVDYNTSTNLEVDLYQAILKLNASEGVIGGGLTTYNATVGNQTVQTTNGTAYFYLASGNYSIVSRAEGFWDNSSSLNVETPYLQQTNATLTFTNYVNVTVADINSSASILNFTLISDSVYINSTTVGHARVFCPIPSCNLSINASFSDYISDSIIHLSKIENAQINLSSAKMFFYFVEADTLNPVVNATVKIDTPDSRQLSLETDVFGKVETSLFYLQDLKEGNYNITLTATQGFVTPISFLRNINSSNVPYNETYAVGKVGLTFNVKNRETGSLLSGKSSDIVFIGYFNVTTITGTYTLENVTIVAGDHIVQALSSGYGTEQKTFTFTGQANATVDFYLLNLTGINTGTLYVNVIDEFYRTIPNAQVRLYEYDTETLDYSIVSETTTNTNGEAFFYVELNVKTYYISAFKEIGGELYSDTTSPERISSDEETRNLFLRFTDTTDVMLVDKLLLEIGHSFTNNISRISVNYSMVDGSSTTICLDYFRVYTTHDDSVYSDCVISSGGSLSRIASINRSNTYFARLYQVLDGGSEIILKEWHYPSIDSFEFIMDEKNYAKPFVLLLWMGLLALCLSLKNITLFAIGTMILSWVEVALFPNTLIISGSVAKTLVSLFLLFISRKKVDTQ